MHDSISFVFLSRSSIKWSKSKSQYSFEDSCNILISNLGKTAGESEQKRLEVCTYTSVCVVSMDRYPEWSLRVSPELRDMQHHHW